jgi:hypothetical protein
MPISVRAASAGPAAGWVTAGGPAVSVQLAPMTEVAGVVLITADSVSGTRAP